VGGWGGWGGGGRVWFGFFLFSTWGPVAIFFFFAYEQLYTLLEKTLHTMKLV